MTELNLEQARFNMIEQQIRPWEVLDQRVLDLLARVPREDFVPSQYRNLAFTDMRIPLGHGQVMMSPKVEARMLQALDIRPDDTVLEIGTGSGYVTALLANLARQVYSVEILAELNVEAGNKLAGHGLDNVTLAVSDGLRGPDEHAPFDVIALTGSLPVLPGYFEQSLKVGGRLFAIVGDAPVMQAELITRVGDNDWAREYLFETNLPALANAPQPERFVL
ncbi:MAG: protein-L-isoaspartate O-methyltransferase [Pseudomonadota bacterium]|nr:MAG: protein-L-isoaspartate O-methyltransferase [Pseudomonadota bacterium]